MAQARTLIVNADDFGLTAGVNRGIIEAHEHGIVTSTSLMVNRPAAADAAAYARRSGSLGVGLHVELGEWVYSEGEWLPTMPVVPLEDSTVVATEIGQQLARFRSLVGRDPTHLDSHQHVHRDEVPRRILVALAGELGVPVRHFSPSVRYCGDFYGQTKHGLPFHEAITVDRLIDIIGALPAGITEVACHPGHTDGLELTYGVEREIELRALLDPRVREAVANARVTRASFATMPS